MIGITWKWKVRLRNFSISKSNRTARITHVTYICFLWAFCEKVTQTWSASFDFFFWRNISLFKHFRTSSIVPFRQILFQLKFHSSIRFSFGICKANTFMGFMISFAGEVCIFERVCSRVCLCDQAMLARIWTSTKLIARIIKTNPCIMSYKSGQFQCSAKEIIRLSQYLPQHFNYRWAIQQHFSIYPTHYTFIYRNNFITFNWQFC